MHETVDVEWVNDFIKRKEDNVDEVDDVEEVDKWSFRLFNLSQSRQRIRRILDSPPPKSPDSHLEYPDLGLTPSVSNTSFGSEPRYAEREYTTLNRQPISNPIIDVFDTHPPATLSRYQYRRKP